MSLETVLIAQLEASAGLIALIGAPPNSRIFSVLMPQDVAYPSVSYFRVSTTRVSAMGSDTGLASTRLQFSAWSKSITEARAVADEVRKALQRFRTLGPPVVQDVFIVNQVEFFEDSILTHQIAVDVEVHFTE